MTGSRRYDGVIFDMDGTLIEPLLDFAALRAELGIAPREGILEAIATMAPEEERLAEAKLLAHELAAARSAKLLPHAAEVLAACRAAGLKTALLTRNTRRAVRIVLERFELLHFDHVHCREDGPVKPEPDGVRRVCAQLDIEPARTVCVGDYRYDIIAANAAGAVSVLLTTHADRSGFAEWCDLADVRIERLAELKTILGV